MFDDHHHHRHHHSDITLGPALRAAVVTVGHAAAHLDEAAGETLRLPAPALVDLEGVGEELGLLSEGLLQGSYQGSVTSDTSENIIF